MTTLGHTLGIIQINMRLESAHLISRRIRVVVMFARDYYNETIVCPNRGARCRLGKECRERTENNNSHLRRRHIYGEIAVELFNIRSTLHFRLDNIMNAPHDCRFKCIIV